MKNNDIDMYSTHNERKSVFAERFQQRKKCILINQMIELINITYISAQFK